MRDNTWYDDPLIIAGPCCVEDLDNYLKTALFLKKQGVKYLRGGLFKPRTSHESFQGLGLDGLEILKKIKKETGMKIVSELIDIRDLNKIEKYVDIIQIGSRNMYNYPLLKEVGKTNKPIILKRAFSATIDEWICSAKYIESSGNNRIILCERGIRSFDNHTRNLVDISCIPILKKNTTYKVILDPSHSTGKTELIEPISLAGIMSGCDGLMIEVHHNPEAALCDGKQSLDFHSFSRIYESILDCYNYREQKKLEKNLYG